MWNLLSITFRHLGDLASAEDSVLRAYPLAEKLDDQEGMGASLNILGLLASIQGDYALAIDYHQRSLAIRQAIGDPMTIAFSLNNLGLVASAQGDYARAIAYGLNLAKHLEKIVLIPCGALTLGPDTDS